MERVLEVWSRATGRLSPRVLMTGLEVVLVALLAVQAARLVWTLAEPAGGLGQAPAVKTQAAKPADLAVFTRFDPFFRVADAGAATTPAEGGSLQLFGVRSDGRGGGSAIIGGPDSRQGSFVVGETVAPGVVLRAVAADHVILARGGGVQRLAFAAPPPSAPPPPPTAGSVAPTLAPAGAESAGRIDPKAFLAAAALTPRTAGGQVSGYRLTGKGQTDVLARAGLRDGDILLSVEGNPLNPERMSELSDLLAQSSEVEIRFERAGQIMTTTLRMAGR